MKRRRTLSLLAAVLVTVVLGYTGAWFYAAGTLKARANTFIAGLTGRGIRAACVNLDVSGFPVRIGLSCDRVEASDPGRGGQVDAGAFRSVAGLVHPGRIVSDLAGPLQMKAPDGYAVKADWGRLQTTARLWFEGLTRASLEIRNLTATVSGPLIAGPVEVRTPGIEAQTHRNGADIDLGFTVDRLSLAGNSSFSALPAADIAGTATLSDMAPLMSGRERISNLAGLMRGRSGTLHKLTMKLAGGASLVVDGPFSFDDAGKLSGRFRLRIERVDAWQRTIDKVLPSARNAAGNIGNMLTAMGGGKDAATITLTASHGRLSLGLIPLGNLPPL